MKVFGHGESSQEFDVDFELRRLDVVEQPNITREAYKYSR